MHVVVQQNLAQHCKAIILQLKKIDKNLNISAVKDGVKQEMVLLEGNLGSMMIKARCTSVLSLGFKIIPRTSLVVQWLRFHTPTAGNLGSYPGQGTRFHMPQPRPGAAK